VIDTFIQLLGFQESATAINAELSTLAALFPTVEDRRPISDVRTRPAQGF
jgi:hypothetical protein